MALVKCPQCGHEISPNAAACPSCGHPIAEKRRGGRLGCLFYLFVIIGGFVLLYNWGKDIEDQEARSPTCVSDYKKCSDNEEVVERHKSKNHVSISVECLFAAKALARFGEPEFPSLSFTRYFPGHDYIERGTATLIEDDARFQNGFGAKEHVAVTCSYDLGADTAAVSVAQSQAKFETPPKVQPSGALTPPVLPIKASDCVATIDLTQRLVCYEDAARVIDNEEANKIEPKFDVTDPNSVMHGNCLTSIFPSDFPNKYQYCILVSHDQIDGKHTLSFTVGSAGSTISTSGDDAGVVYDRFGNEEKTGYIEFTGNIVAAIINNNKIYVQNIDYASLTFPSQIAKFADKCYPSGICVPRWLSKSTGTCIWRDPFITSRVAVCDVNTAVGQFHLAFRRGAYIQH